MVVNLVGLGTKNDCAGGSAAIYPNKVAKASSKLLPQSDLQKDHPLLFSKKTHELSWKEQKYGYEFQWSQKPRMTMLTKASSKFLLCLGQTSVRNQL
jgi:hypothetical protein